MEKPQEHTPPRAHGERTRRLSFLAIVLAALLLAGCNTIVVQPPKAPNPVFNICNTTVCYQPVPWRPPEPGHRKD